MKPGTVRSKGITALALVVAGTANCGAAVAKLTPPAYLDLPIAPGTFESVVATPLIADDFEPGLGGTIAYIEWWGSLARDPWQLTLYSNADPGPTAPDPGGATIVVDASLLEAWDDLFHYVADVTTAGWKMSKGESYWLSVASFERGWTWALADGAPDFFGEQRQLAVGSLGIGAWRPLDPASHLAFGVWPTLVPEPRMWGLMMIGVLGLGLSPRRLRRGLAAVSLNGVWWTTGGLKFRAAETADL